jgi:hypothetical protein
LQEKLGTTRRGTAARQPDWMQGFGELKRLHRETARVQSVIDEAFETVEPEDHL